jgi:hypothetical protein
MELDKKVVAAISTAVTSYIQEEKAAEVVARGRRTCPMTNVWGRTGRQEIMRNRQMWQLRIVSR